MPAYNEEATLGALAADVARVLGTQSYEMIIVDDGSRDGTWARIQSLAAQNAAIRGVRLTRNFGHQPAILAGLNAALGEAVLTMDADGQHPATLIPALMARWREGYEVVQAVRTATEGEALFKRVSSRAFYRILMALGGPPVPVGSADFRLLARPVVQTVLDSVGPLIFMRGLIPWLGYPTAYEPFQAGRRDHGESTYTLWRMLRLSAHGLLSFSIVPLRLSMLVGLAVAVLSFLYLLLVLVAFLQGNQLVPGWASVMGLMSLLGGIQLIMFGVLGEYVGRIFVGQLNRPHYVVRDRV